MTDAAVQRGMDAVSEAARRAASPVPERRGPALAGIVAALAAAERIVLTTHVNADGDGAGSEAAVAGWLEGLGKTVHIANPTPFPPLYLHLLDGRDLVRDATHPGTAAVLRAADTLFVLDTCEPRRIGRLAASLRGKRVVVLDHHVASEGAITGTSLQDASACATGELVYDLLTVAGLERPWPAAVREGIYTAIVTDTGSFRFSNTHRRAHEIAGELIEQGVDPEQVYRQIYATVPLRRVQLLRYALDHLELDEPYPTTFISIERGVIEHLGVNADDLEGLVEHARSVEGTVIALLFRETADGATKVSLRSAGDVDVNAIARTFGGGGHVKASGALIGAPLDSARARVLAAVRSALDAAGAGTRVLRDTPAVEAEGGPDRSR
jgi:phosphoesterase RecJ-like protein